MNVVDLVSLVKSGLLPDSRAIVRVDDRLGQPGSGDPARVLVAELAGSAAMEVLPSRGLDIGQFWVLGSPVSWFSPIRDARPLSHPTGSAWMSRFNGGLLVTCGLRNIGRATESEGMHGDFSHLPASGVRVACSLEPAGVRVVIEGSIYSAQIFGPSFRIDRIISGFASEAVVVLEITDAVTNIGSTPAELSMLYHVNFGAPAVLPGSEISVVSDRVVAREENLAVPSWSAMPEPVNAVTEAVFKHDVRADAEGMAYAEVRGRLGLLRLGWSADTLPHLHQWIVPTRRRWALGLEPATAPLFGGTRNGDAFRSSIVAPDAVRLHKLILSVQSSTGRLEHTESGSAELQEENRV